MMSHICFAAWGSVDIEKMDRMNRRRYIKAVREELAKHNLTMEVGGQRDRPYYLLSWTDNENKKQAFASNTYPIAFKQVMEKVLELIPHEEQEAAE